MAHQHTGDVCGEFTFQALVMLVKGANHGPCYLGLTRCQPFVDKAAARLERDGVCVHAAGTAWARSPFCPN